MEVGGKVFVKVLGSQVKPEEIKNRACHNRDLLLFFVMGLGTLTNHAEPGGTITKGDNRRR